MMDDSFAFVFLPAFDLLLEGAWKQFRPHHHVTAHRPTSVEGLSFPMPRQRACDGNRLKLCLRLSYFQRINIPK